MVPLPKTARYKAVSKRLNWSSRAVKLNVGFTAFAAAIRALRALAAVAMVMNSLPPKLATTLSQMVELKLWLSPKKMSLRLRLPSCSMTEPVSVVTQLGLPVLVPTSVLVQVIEIQRAGVARCRGCDGEFCHWTAGSWFKVQGLVNAVDQLVYRHVSAVAWQETVVRQ